jgi:hypothetical protein
MIRPFQSLLALRNSMRRDRFIAHRGSLGCSGLPRNLLRQTNRVRSPSEWKTVNRGIYEEWAMRSEGVILGPSVLGNSMRRGRAIAHRGSARLQQVAEESPRGRRIGVRSPSEWKIVNRGVHRGVCKGGVHKERRRVPNGPNPATRQLWRPVVRPLFLWTRMLHEAQKGTCLDLGASC